MGKRWGGVSGRGNWRGEARYLGGGELPALDLGVWSSRSGPAPGTSIRIPGLRKGGGPEAGGGGVHRRGSHLEVLPWTLRWRRTGHRVWVGGPAAQGPGSHPAPIPQHTWGPGLHLAPPAPNAIGTAPAARRDPGHGDTRAGTLTPVRPDNGRSAADAASALIFPKLKSAARRLRLRPPRFSAV